MNKSLPTLPPSSGLKQRAPASLAASVPALSRQNPAGSNDASSMPGGLDSQQLPQRDDKDWISSTSSSSGESSSGHIQRNTVKKQRTFTVGSPRSPRKKASGTRNTGAFDGTSSPRRRKDSAGVNALLSPSKSRNNDAKQTRRSTKTRGTPWTTQLMNALAPLRLLVSIVTHLLGIALSPIQSALTTFFLLAFILASAYYLLLPQLRHSLSLLLPSSALSILSLPFSPLNKNLLTNTYCSYIGIGCEPEVFPIAKLARAVSDQALQATDIFQSVVALGRPDTLQLHHTEVWELAVAVKATSELENKESLGSHLKELGDYTRDIKDSMSSLNAKGVNAFSWLMHEFTRVEKTIELLHKKTGRYRPEDVSRQLDALFHRLSSDLSSLVKDIETAIPIAKRASDLGERVMIDLSTEHARLYRAKEETPLWRRLKDARSFAANQLRRDLKLCGDSVTSLSATRRGLEEARGFLVGYRDQVSYFKASAVGFHVADHGLDPEDEVETLKNIMQNFQLAVAEAKGTGLPRPQAQATLDELD